MKNKHSPKGKNSMGLLADSSLTKDDSESFTNKAKNKRGRLNSLVQNKPSDNSQQLKEEICICEHEHCDCCQKHWRGKAESYQIGFKEGKKQAIEEVEKLLNEDKIYPKDIFPEITAVRIRQVNGFLKANFGFPLDRLSAHIGRLLLRGIKSKIKEELR